MEEREGQAAAALFKALKVFKGFFHFDFYSTLASFDRASVQSGEYRTNVFVRFSSAKKPRRRATRCMALQGERQLIRCHRISSLAIIVAEDRTPMEEPAKEVSSRGRATLVRVFACFVHESCVCV